MIQVNTYKREVNKHDGVGDREVLTQAKSKYRTSRD